VKKLFKKNQIMITALALMIAVAGYLNFAGTKIGEEDFISVDGSSSELTYEISDEDMYAISLREDSEGDLLSLDTDDTEIAANYLESDMEYADNTDGTGATVIEQETPGEAVFTSASGVSTIAGAKLLKEQTKAQNKASLMEIINNEELTEEAKKEAVNSMITLTENTQKESDAQMLLEAKGFTQAVVSISGDMVDVMVAASTLTTAETAQIIDIVQRKTEIAAENIIITVSKTE
jgi:stage III sporulation protein AH